MANDLTKNPLEVDTAATITHGGSGMLNIRELIWIGATNAHALVLTINGKDVTFTTTVAIDGVEKYLLQQPLGWVQSFVVKTIPSGKLYIFLD
jgi:hypothetical protein